MTDSAARLGAALADRYHVEREIGQGGMATVYLAQDLRHHRQVAIKVLHPELSAVLGAERFLSEIRTTAALQHPHILPLFDSGTADELLFYVMPLVEGETLRARLTREKQLPVADAVRIATEVAGALDYAHRHGVVHRDIKPENILLHEGSALVADFGIALAVQQAGGQRMTQTGLSLGTPQYMSPEQAMGDRALDARTDLYALGVVTYEMLAGEPPFTGPTAQSIVAKVLTEKPHTLRALRETVPASVEAAVLRALAKLPADRFTTAAEFAAAMHAGVSDAASAGTSVSPITPRTPPSSAARMMRVVPWVVAAGAVLVAVAIAMRRGTAAPVRVTAAVLPLELRSPDDAPLNEIGSPVSIAPDGSFIVFVGPDPDVPTTTALWKRPLDRLDATPIAGTRDAQEPVIAGDGKSVQYFTRAPSRSGNDRWETGFDGGLPQQVNGFRGLRRLRDGSAVVAESTLFRLVPAGDPLPRGRGPLSVADRRSWDVSPGARWILTQRKNGLRDSILIRSFDGTESAALAEGVSPRFLDRDLIAFRAPDGTLEVGRLDADRKRLVAPPVSVVPNVSVSGNGSAVYSVGDDGTLVYAPGGSAAQSRLVWVTGDRELPVPDAEPHVYGGVVLSPDGRRAAVTIGALTGSGDIWILDLSQGSLSPLTSDGLSSRPAWTPDGKSVTYLHSVLGGSTGNDSIARPPIYQRLVDGTAPAETLSGPWPGVVDEVVWSPDGRYAALRVRAGSRGTPLLNRDIRIWRVNTDSTIPFATEPAQERGPRISPDGKWLQYVSDRSGRDEIYVDAFPGGGHRVQVSSDGGTEGVWSHDGSEIFYRAPDRWMMAAHVLTHGVAVQVLKRDRLFDASPYLANQFLVMYDVAPDGRFLMIKRDPQPARTDVVIIRNWVQQVTARLAQSSR